MRRILVGVVCGVAALLSVAPTHAASNPRGSGQGSSADWSQRDQAVYVVSTINLLRTHKGTPVSTIMQNRMGVRRFNVYADNSVTDLFFIDLVRGDGSTAGTLAYTLGSPRPVSASTATDRLHIPRASVVVLSEYRTDRKTLIGSFTSTTP